MFKILGFLLLISSTNQMNVDRNCMYEDAMDIVQSDFDLEKVCK